MCYLRSFWSNWALKRGEKLRKYNTNICQDLRNSCYAQRKGNGHFPRLSYSLVKVVVRLQYSSNISRGHASKQRKGESMDTKNTRETGNERVGLPPPTATNCIEWTKNFTLFLSVPQTHSLTFACSLTYPVSQPPSYFRTLSSFRGPKKSRTKWETSAPFCE